MKIPKTIHRIWFGGPMPKEFIENGKRWKELHPNWELIEWTDESELPKLRNQKIFDNAQEYYPNDWKRFKADLLRLEILNQYGGLYTDTDSTPLKNLEPLIGDSVWMAARSPQNINHHHPIANGFIATVPHHTFTKHLIRMIQYSLVRFGHRTLARSIGPWHLTREYESLSKHWPDVTILGPNEFYNSEWLTHTWNNKASKRGRGAK